MAAKRPWMAAFLVAYRKTGNMTLSARAAGIDRDTVYVFCQRHPDHPFVEQMRQAKDEAMDLLEAEALRRARDGFEEPVFGNLGRDEHGHNMGTGVVGHVRRYSDGLLKLLLEAGRPDVYRPRTAIDVSGTIVTESQADRDLAEVVAWFESVARRSEGPGDATAGSQGPTSAVGE
jgi:hypothetical protein